MVLNAALLRGARIKNVERLARALGLRLPSRFGGRAAYRKRLVDAVLGEIRRDVAAFELQRLRRENIESLRMSA